MGSDVNQGLGPHWLMSRDVDEPCGQKGGILSRVAPLGSDYLAVAVLTASTCQHINTC